MPRTPILDECRARTIAAALRIRQQEQADAIDRAEKLRAARQRAADKKKPPLVQHAAFGKTASTIVSRSKTEAQQLHEAAHRASKGRRIAVCFSGQLAIT